MPETLTLSGFDELQDLYDGVSEDFADIDYTDWMEGQLHDLSEIHQTYFEGSTSPDGIAWQPNKPSTIKAKGHARILRGKPKFGFRLSKSLTTRSHGSSGDMIREAIQSDTAAYLGFGTAVEYSGFNDFGTSTIPARPHIGIDDKYLDGVVNSVADYTVNELAKG